ncbi:MAG TPA: hypothetical protein VM695_02880 [Phycisphaerae bacterium]|nr:hypothetical protein [Phycisphaerae bacterium]
MNVDLGTAVREVMGKAMAELAASQAKRTALEGELNRLCREGGEVTALLEQRLRLLKELLDSLRRCLDILRELEGHPNEEDDSLA